MAKADEPQNGDDEGVPQRVRGGEVSIPELRAFAAVVENGSFSRAAATLLISQPTVSLRLQSLEERLSLRLLERRSGIVLTEPGRDLYNRARQILSTLDEFAAAVGDLRALRRGRLRVGFSTPAFAMPALGRLRKDHPELSLKLTAGNTAALVTALRGSAIDAAIMTMRVPPGELATRQMAEQRLLGLVAAASPSPRTLDWTALAEETVILREGGSMTRELAEDQLERAGVRPRAIIEAPTREATREAAAAGLGIGVVLSGETGDDRRVRPVEFAPAAATAGVFVATSNGARTLPAVAALFEAAAPGVTDTV